MSGLKKGTKLTETPKSYMLRVRLDMETVEQLNKCSEAEGVPKSEIVRRGIREQFAKIEK